LLPEASWDWMEYVRMRVIYTTQLLVLLMVGMDEVSAAIL
jgi:hypothetical protein